MRTLITFAIVLVVSLPLQAQKIVYGKEWKKQMGKFPEYERMVSVKVTSACPTCHTYWVPLYHSEVRAIINEIWEEKVYSVSFQIARVGSLDITRDKRDKFTRSVVKVGEYTYVDNNGDGLFDVMINGSAKSVEEKVFILFERKWIAVKDAFGGITNEATNLHDVTRYVFDGSTWRVKEGVKK